MQSKQNVIMFTITQCVCIIIHLYNIDLKITEGKSDNNKNFEHKVRNFSSEQKLKSNKML